MFSYNPQVSTDESVEAKCISRRQPDLAKEIQLAEKYDHTYETLEEVVQGMNSSIDLYHTYYNITLFIMIICSAYFFT